MRMPSDGVIKMLKEWYCKYGHQDMKTKEGAIVLSILEQARGIENYLKVITDVDYLQLLGIVKRGN